MDMPRRTIGEWVQISCDLILLNILWLVCCLPIVTIGASTAAMQNWKQATAVTVILGVVLLISWADFTIGLNNPGLTGIACQVIGVLGMIAGVFTLTLAFPVLTRYRLPLRTVLKNAALLSLANPHIVLVGLAAAALFPALIVWNIDLLGIAVPGWVLLGGGLPVLAEQLLMRKVYARLEAGQITEESNHGDSETHL